MRVTATTLRSGQPRPYADTIRQVQVKFELANWDKSPEAEQWLAFDIDEERVRAILPHLMVGFTDITEPEGWWSTRLDYLKKIDVGVWEFHTTTPFTD